MKSEYGYDKEQRNNSKSYQASANQSNNNRNPNAPTQGGFSTPGGGNLGQQQKQNQKNPQPNKQPNTWGTGSINKNDKDRQR